MNKKEFLEKLIKAYPFTFYDYLKGENGATTKIAKKDSFEKYMDALPESNYYEGAYRLMLNNHTDTQAPQPASIKGWLRNVTPIEPYRIPKEWKAEPIPEHCLVEIEKLRKKLEHRAILKKIGG
jgi:hypothetical protein